jgi:hypothetical protein
MDATSAIFAKEDEYVLLRNNRAIAARVDLLLPVRCD